MRKYADCLQQSQYGTGLPTEVVIHHFMKTLADRRIERTLVAHDFLTLQAAVDIADRLEKVYKRESQLKRATERTTDQPTSRGRCFLCHKAGHKI